ncbi:MAG: sulfite exporter TauE/SafE family protein [Proteobacteria bacterium]|nr:sulfite exporter TauE/SafE family protein [Pseudomonadota bacterium]
MLVQYLAAVFANDGNKVDLRTIFIMDDRMETQVLLSYLALLAFGAYVQTVTGFALGLFVMGVATLMDLSSVAVSAAIVTISSLVNTGVALSKEHHHVDWQQVRRLSVGLLPAMMVGMWLLDNLDGGTSEYLKILLGLFIVIGAILLMLKPHPRKQPSGALKTMSLGAIAGLFGGLFSTAGPPVVYHLYREPIAINTIRMTMLALFAIATLVRLMLAIPAGHVNQFVIWVCLYGAPVIVLFTWAGQRFVPPLSDMGMRRTAFGLLFVIGIVLLLPAVSRFVTGSA